MTRKSRSSGGIRRFAPSVERVDLAVRKTADPIESYANRIGYREDFLGTGVKLVPPPSLAHWEGPDRIVYRLDDSSQYLLTYEHFSVAVSRERRMPLFSAVNINGSTCKSRVARSNVWKLDPRIPAKSQILTECYGREGDGYFSRGHMTRREDAKWGPAPSARRAEADSFHVTNAVPQAQSFNAPIWLRLEDRLLKHARADGMKISVITGPVFADDDLEMFEVRVPRRFWKVIAFIHDDTHRLSLTGYIASQAEQVADLRQVQFVFGRYRGWQVPIRQIARLSDLDFDRCVRADVLASADDRFAFELRSVADVYTV